LSSRENDLGKLGGLPPHEKGGGGGVQGRYKKGKGKLHAVRVTRLPDHPLETFATVGALGLVLGNNLLQRTKNGVSAKKRGGDGRKRPTETSAASGKSGQGKRGKTGQWPTRWLRTGLLEGLKTNPVEKPQQKSQEKVREDTTKTERLPLVYNGRGATMPKSVPSGGGPTGMWGRRKAGNHPMNNY